MSAAAVDEALVERKNALVEAFHAYIDGDYLVGGGGWGRDGSEALAEHDAAVRREVAEEIAAAFEARAVGKSQLVQATYERDALIARTFAAHPRSP